MPKLRRMFSSVSAPFCWPTKAMRRPSMRAKPATIAVSSPKPRSPWSSMTSSAISARRSSVRGRARLRASWTRFQTAVLGSTGSRRLLPSALPLPLPSVRGSSGRPSRRSTTAATVPAVAAMAAIAAGDGREECADRVERGGRRLLELVARHAHEPKQGGDLGAELATVHDPVDEAVLEEELAALEAGRQLLGDRACRDAGAGKADQRVGL